MASKDKDDMKAGKRKVKGMNACSPTRKIMAKHNRAKRKRAYVKALS